MGLVLNGNIDDAKVLAKSIKKAPDPNYKHRDCAQGGQHSKIQGLIKRNESHHMPADSVSPISKSRGPSISMKKSHHRNTASWGPGIKKDEYRQAQADLIKDGKFREAVNMDIDDVRSKYDDLYDQEIEDMLKYLDSTGL